MANHSFFRLDENLKYVTRRRRSKRGRADAAADIRAAVQKLIAAVPADYTAEDYWLAYRTELVRRLERS